MHPTLLQGSMQHDRLAHFAYPILHSELTKLPMLYFAPKMIRWFFLALVLGFLTACGGGGGGGGTTAAAVVANFTVNPATPEVNTTVTFDGSSSTGSISNWSWTFDGSDTLTGSTVTKTFTTAGDHVVSLTVSDGSGAENTTQQTITVSAANVAPTAAFTADQTTVATGVAVNFDASDSSDTDGTITSYQWNFGGGTSTTATGQAVSNTYTTVGTYTVSLTVTDDDGQESTPVTQTIQVTAPFTSYTATQTDGMNVEFTVQPSASLGTVTNYEWVFGDGSTMNTGGTNTASHNYLASGDVTVDVTATSTNSQGASANFDITVKNDVTRIIVIGDSISEGYGGQRSYRYDLWEQLVNEDYAVDFIGTRSALTTGLCSTTQCPNITQAGPVPRVFSFDPQHQAESGIRADEVDGQLSAILSNGVYTNGANVALIHLGTNDLLQNRSAADTAASLQSIINTLQARFPEIHILIAQIIPYAADTGEVTDLNNLIATFSAQTNVYVVNQFAGYNAGPDNFDGIHPNTNGESKLANKWYDALVASGELN